MTYGVRKMNGEWTKPGVIIGLIGLLAAFVSSYSTFDSRISVLEREAQRLVRIEDKLDRLGERFMK